MRFKVSLVKKISVGSGADRRLDTCQPANDIQPHQGPGTTPVGAADRASRASRLGEAHLAARQKYTTVVVVVVV